MRYGVDMPFSSSYYVEIEADSVEEAIIKARKLNPITDKVEIDIVITHNVLDKTTVHEVALDEVQVYELLQ